MGAPVEFAEEGGIFAPFGGDFDEQVEEETAAEKGFEFEAGFGADAFETFGLRAEDDGFLAGAFDVDGGGDVGDFGGVFPLVNEDGDGVGDFLAGEGEDLLADDFSGDEAFGLVGVEVVGEEGVAGGEALEDGLAEVVDALVLGGADGEVVLEVVAFAEPF